MNALDPLPLRLHPGDDLRRCLEARVRERGQPAFVLCAIGSLAEARLRLAGADEAMALAGDMELLTLAGSVTADGAHLHASLALADGRVLGGHLGHGCRVRTTAEVLLAFLPHWQLGRAPDAATGYAELVADRR